MRTSCIDTIVLSFYPGYQDRMTPHHDFFHSAFSEFADIAYFNKCTCDGYSSPDGDGQLDLIIVPAAYAGVYIPAIKVLSSCR